MAIPRVERAKRRWREATRCRQLPSLEEEEEDDEKPAAGDGDQAVCSDQDRSSVGILTEEEAVTAMQANRNEEQQPFLGHEQPSKVKGKSLERAQDIPQASCTKHADPSKQASSSGVSQQPHQPTHESTNEPRSATLRIPGDGAADASHGPTAAPAASTAEGTRSSGVETGTHGDAEDESVNEQPRPPRNPKVRFHLEQEIIGTPVPCCSSACLS